MNTALALRQEILPAVIDNELRSDALLWKNWYNAKEFDTLGLDGMWIGKVRDQLRGVSLDYVRGGGRDPQTKQILGKEWHFLALPPEAQGDLNRRREREIKAFERADQPLTPLMLGYKQPLIPILGIKDTNPKFGVVSYIEHHLKLSKNQYLNPIIMGLMAQAALHPVEREPMAAIALEPFEVKRQARMKADKAAGRRGKRVYLGVSRRELYMIWADYKEGILSQEKQEILVRSISDFNRAWIPDFMRFYGQLHKPRQSDARRDYNLWAKEHGKPEVTEDQVRYALKRANIQRNALMTRHGKLAQKALKSYNVRDTSLLFSGSVFTADGKTFDAEIANPKSGYPYRPEITSVLDVVSRKCVGFSVALDESARAVSEALRRACITHCIPSIFYTDNGPGYRNNTMNADVTGLLVRLGITHKTSLPYNAQGKGIIERFNHVWSNLATQFATSLHKDNDRQDRQLVHRRTRSELKKQGLSTLLPSFKVFLDACEAEIGHYNNSPHSALPKVEEGGKMRHMTPNEAWDHFNIGVDEFKLNSTEVRTLFYPHEIRKTTRGMVQLWTNSYFSLELEKYHGFKVILAVDIHDAKKIWVYEFNKNKPEGEQAGGFICEAIFHGNHTHYFAPSVLEMAADKREKARVGRLQAKIDVVREEKRGRMIDATYMEEVHPCDIIGLEMQRQHKQELMMVEVMPTMHNQTMPRQIILQDRPPDDEADYIEWCLAKDGKGEPLAPSQWGYFREAFYMGGIEKRLYGRGVDTELIKTKIKTLKQEGVI
jgi:transposase InsO family protein